MPNEASGLAIRRDDGGEGRLHVGGQDRHDRQRRKAGNLGDREHDIDHVAAANTDVVDRSQHRKRDGGHHLPGGNVEGAPRSRQRHQHCGRGKRGNEEAQILGEPHRHTCNAAADDYEQRHPAVEKRRQLAIRLTQKHVDATRPGKHCPHLGVCEAAGDREHAAERPGEKEQRGRRNMRGHPSGRQKDARADHIADNQHDCRRSPMDRISPSSEVPVTAVCVGIQAILGK